MPNRNRNCTVSIRFTEKEKQTLEQTAQGLGFKSISDYLRHLHNEKINAHIPIEYDPPERSVECFIRLRMVPYTAAIRWITCSMCRRELCGFNNDLPTLWFGQEKVLW